MISCRRCACISHCKCYCCRCRRVLKQRDAITTSSAQQNHNKAKQKSRRRLSLLRRFALVSTHAFLSVHSHRRRRSALHRRHPSALACLATAAKRTRTTKGYEHRWKRKQQVTKRSGTHLGHSAIRVRSTPSVQPSSVAFQIGCSLKWRLRMILFVFSAPAFMPFVAWADTMQ